MTLRHNEGQAEEVKKGVRKHEMMMERNEIK